MGKYRPSVRYLIEGDSDCGRGDIWACEYYGLGWCITYTHDMARRFRTRKAAENMLAKKYAKHEGNLRVVSEIEP